MTELNFKCLCGRNIFLETGPGKYIMCVACNQVYNQYHEIVEVTPLGENTENTIKIPAIGGHNHEY